MKKLSTLRNSRRSIPSIFYLKTVACLIILTMCFSKSYAQFQQRVYANTTTTNIEPRGTVTVLSGVTVNLEAALNLVGISLSSLGSASNTVNAVNNDVRTHATLSATYLTANVPLVLNVKVGALVSQTLGFPSTYSGNKPVTVKLGIGGGLAQTVLDGLTVQATLNGVPVGQAIGKSNGLVGLLGNESVIELTFAPNVQYNGVRISLSSENQLAALNALQSVDIYHAYVLQDVTQLPNCDGPFDMLKGAQSAVAALGTVQNLFNAIDGDVNSFANIASGASVIADPTQGMSITSIFPSYSKIGDSLKIVVGSGNTLLDLNLLAGIRIQTINRAENGTETILQDFNNTQLLYLNLNIGGAGSKGVITIPTTQSFNRVRIFLGGVAAVLSNLRVYEISRTAASPVIGGPGLDPSTNTATICAGTPFTLTIQNPEPGSVYRWWSSATATTFITDGVSADGTSFTPSNLVLGANNYFVSVVRAGCGNEASARTRTTINVNPSPLASDILVAGNTAPICAGSPVVLTPSLAATTSIPIPNPVFRWYRNADKTGEILNGTADGAVNYAIAGGVLTVNGLTASQTYYVSVTPNNGAGCENGASELKAVTVTINPLAVDATIEISDVLTQCLGASFTINPSASSVQNPVFRYYFDAAKTQPITTSTVGGVDYTLNGNILGVSSATTISNLNIYITVSGDNYCENVLGKTVTLNQTSTVNPVAFDVVSQNICGTGAAVFQITNHQPGFTYAIYDAASGGGLVTSGVTITTANQIVFSNVTASGVFYVELTTASGCTAGMRTQLNINYLPAVPPANLSTPTVNGGNGGNICADVSGNFILTTGSTGLTNPIYYLYDGSAALVATNTTGVFPLGALTPGVAVTYTVSVSADGFCETLSSDRKSIFFTPNSLPATPTLNFTGIKVVQEGQNIQLIVTPPVVGATSYQWSKDGVLLAETTNVLTINNLTASNLGIYSVVALNAANCASSASASVNLSFSDLIVWKSYAISTGATSSVRGGEDVTYTIHVRNASAATKTGYTITDPIPTHTTLVSIADGGVDNAGTISWTGITIPASSTITRSFTVKVAGNLTGVNLIGNIAYLDNGIDPQQPSLPPNPNDPNQPGGNPGDVGTNIPVDQITNTVTWKAFSIAGSTATTVSGGETVNYTVYVRNIGNQTIPSLLIRDIIPTNTTYASVGNGGVYDAGANSVIWSAIALEPAQTASVTFAVTVNADLTGVTAVQNIAYSNDGTNPDQPSLPPAGPNTPTEPSTDTTNPGTDIPVVPTNSFVSLLTVVSSNANGKANSGDVLTYTLAITNTGNQALTGITVAEPVPANTVFLSASAGGALSGNNVVFNVPNLSPGGATTLTVQVTVGNNLAGVSAITNSANITTAQASGTSNIATIAVGITDFATTYTVTSNNPNGQANPNDELTYTLVVTNTGTEPLTGISVNNPVPPNTTFVSTSSGTLTGNTVVTPLPNLLPGESATITVIVKVDSDLTGVTQISNTANVTATGVSKTTDPAVIQVNQVASFNTLLTVTSSNSNGKANAGDVLTYTLAISNTGNQSLTGITVTEPVPTNTTFLNASAGGSLNGTNVVFAVPNLAPGTATTLTVQVTVGDNLAGVTSITNSANIATSQASGTSNIASIAVGITDFATSFTVSSSNNNGLANPGDQLTYTLVVTNVGTEPLTNLVITDPVPANTTFMSASNGGTLAGGNVTIPVGNLPAGSSVTATIVVSVNADLTGVTVISNTANVASSQVTKSTNPATISVNQSADFTANLTVSSANANGLANAGDLLTYVLTINNTGNQTLTNLSITDPVPANTTFVSATNGGAVIGGNVLINLPSLAPAATASVTIVVRVNSNLTGVTEITNTANIASSQATKTSNTAVINVQQNVNFTTTLSVNSANTNGFANANDILTYTLVINNIGTQTLTNIAVADPLPAFTDFVSASNNGTLTNGVINFNLPDVGPGQSATATISVRVKADLTGVTQITNTAVVNAAQASRTTNPAVIAVQQNPNLSTSLTVASSNANGRANAGDILTYTLVITNTGDQKLTGVTVAEPVPLATIFQNASNGGGVVNGRVLFNIPDLNPTQSVTVTLQVRVLANLTGISTITNAATVTTNQLVKQTLPANINVLQVKMLTANLTVVSNNENGKANPLDELTYTLTVTNTGDQRLTNLKVADPVPANTQFLSVSDNGTLVGNNIMVDIPALDPNQNATIGIKVRVLNQLRGVNNITNRATVSVEEMSVQSNIALIDVFNKGNEAYIPNAFTPNGDGKNDYFQVLGNNVLGMDMNVYNQWGQRIFQSGDLARGWDGTFNGVAQPSGVYVYYINVTFSDGATALKKGTVTLLR